VYLLENGTCKAKKKTKIARKTLEPLYQQHLLFDESPQGKVLQVMTSNAFFSLSVMTVSLTLCKCKLENNVFLSLLWKEVVKSQFN